MLIGPGKCLHLYLIHWHTNVEVAMLSLWVAVATPCHKTASMIHSQIRLFQVS